MAKRLVGMLVLVAAMLVPAAAPATAHDALIGLPSDFQLVRHGPFGGTVWEGRIPNHFVSDPRLSDVYLPPGYSTYQTYPVFYVLHGFWGSPGSLIHGVRFADIADEQIMSGRAEPFIAVMPPGGPRARVSMGEWAGAWERYVVDDVVPWVEEHLPVDTTYRAIGGLSAGAYGAVDIGLRHLGMFQTLESWGGYFRPFRDGPFVRASAADLAAHDPVLLARREIARIHQDHVRIFLSTGQSGHGSVAARWTFEYARELASLHIEHQLWVLPAGQDHLWRRQLPAAIDYAMPG